MAELGSSAGHLAVELGPPVGIGVEAAGAERREGRACSAHRAGCTGTGELKLWRRVRARSSELVVLLSDKGGPAPPRESVERG